MRGPTRVRAVTKDCHSPQERLLACPWAARGGYAFIHLSVAINDKLFVLCRVLTVRWIGDASPQPLSEQRGEQREGREGCHGTLENVPDSETVSTPQILRAAQLLLRGVVGSHSKPLCSSYWSVLGRVTSDVLQLGVLRVSQNPQAVMLLWPPPGPASSSSPLQPPARQAQQLCSRTLSRKQEHLGVAASLVVCLGRCSSPSTPPPSPLPQTLSCSREVDTVVLF